MKKLLWPEGMFLTQQHFQIANEEIHYTMRESFDLLSPSLWGFIDYEMSCQHEFVLEKAKLRLPNGEIHSIQQPLTISLPERREVDIYLALPNNSFVRNLEGYPERDQDSRWLASYERRSDLYDLSREQELVLAEANWYLRIDPPGPMHWSMKIASLISDQQVWRSSKEFWPPVCRVGASKELMSALSQIRLRMTSTLKELDQYNTTHRGWLLNIRSLLRGVLVDLASIDAGYQQQPHQIFYICQRLHQELQPYVETEKSIEYSQGHIANSFRNLFDALAYQLSSLCTAIPQGIELKELNTFMRRAELDPITTPKMKALYLGVEGTETDDLIRRCPQLITISAPSILPQLRMKALPGIPFSLSRQLPSELFVKPGYVYFEMQKDNPHWDAITREGALELYLNQSLSQTKMELQAVSYGIE